MLTSVEHVDRWSERGKSSTKSRRLLNALYHSCARVFDKVDSPWAFCNIFSHSAHEIPFAMQNLRPISCTIFLSIGKIVKHTWDKLTTSSTVNKLNDRSCSNFRFVWRTVVPTYRQKGFWKSLQAGFLNDLVAVLFWQNVLSLKETILMNKVEFLEKTVFFLVRLETYWVMYYKNAF